MPGPAGELVPGVQGVRVFQAEDSLADRPQRGEHVPGAGQAPRLPGRDGELVPSVQRVRVFQAEDSLADRPQRGEHVPGAGQAPRLPGPDGELVPRGQRIRVLQAEYPFPRVKRFPLDILGCRVITARSQVIGNSSQPVAVILVTPAADGSVSVHRLVQAVTADQMPAELARDWQQAAAALIAAAIPGDTDLPETWQVCAALLPHARVALADDSHGLARIANYLGASGNYPAAQDVQRKTLNARERVLGLEHPDTLAARHQL